MKEVIVSWLGRVMAWISQTVNLFLLFGHHDQTISARCYVNRHRMGWGLGYKVINKIFFWQMDHCLISFESDVIYAGQILMWRRNN